MTFTEYKLTDKSTNKPNIQTQYKAFNALLSILVTISATLTVNFSRYFFIVLHQSNIFEDFSVFLWYLFFSFVAAQRELQGTGCSRICSIAAESEGSFRLWNTEIQTETVNHLSWSRTRSTQRGNPTRGSGDDLRWSGGGTLDWNWQVFFHPFWYFLPKKKIYLLQYSVKNFTLRATIYNFWGGMVFRIIYTPNSKSNNYSWNLVWSKLVSNNKTFATLEPVSMFLGVCSLSWSGPGLPSILDVWYSSGDICGERWW